MSGDVAADSGGDSENTVKVMDFRSRDEPEFQKPDHDPHGEVPAAAAHCSASCDNDECDTSGLLPQAVLEEACGGIRGVEPYSIACSEECADALR